MSRHLHVNERHQESTEEAKKDFRESLWTALNDYGHFGDSDEDKKHLFNYLCYTFHCKEPEQQELTDAERSRIGRALVEILPTKHDLRRYIEKYVGITH